MVSALVCMVIVGIEHLKVRHDVTKLDFIVTRLYFLYINIDLSIQPYLLHCT